ncbi:MAG TPA: prolyl oligopeptidase family serine peptidase, partial [Gaiellaceae bacterium]|nr:prolyl oligopeptidase family serine peptidase [Gaiellaceae bacterium]
VIAHATAQRCLSGPEALVSVATNILNDAMFSRSPSSGALGRRLLENIPLQPIKAPLMVAQGLADTLVLPSAQEKYVNALCASGQQLEYRTYRGYDHVAVVADPQSPLIRDLFQWTKDRLTRTPPPRGCTTIRR